MGELKNQNLPFLKLPPEIRNEIYRYLLCTKYTKRLSKSGRRKFPMLWPGYSYEFHTSILRTSRQIHHEATYLARHENHFVLIRTSSSYPMDAFRVDVNAVRVNVNARGLGQRVMDIELGLNHNRFGQGIEVNLICYDQLSPMCEGLLQFSGKLIGRYNEPKTRMTFKIAVLGFSQDRKIASTTLPILTQQQLLEPFMMLSHAHECYIDGPVSPDYKTKVIQQVCRQDWSPKACLQKVISLIKEGKDAFLESRYACAVQEYLSALKVLLFKIDLLIWDATIIPDGELFGDTYTAITCRYVHWKLPFNIVAAYLKLHQWQDAYDWAHYVVSQSGYRGYDSRGYVVLLLHLALVSNELGEHERAGREYRQGNLIAEKNFIGVKEDREIDALRLALTVPNGEHLAAALEEITV